MLKVVAPQWSDCYTCAVRDPQSKDFIHSSAFLHGLMARQLRLAILCAAAFLIFLLGLPVCNFFLPEVMSQKVFGFPLNWLFLGILFFPLVWTISFIFIRRSMALERTEVDNAKREAARL